MVKFTQVIGSEKKAINLCNDCAQKQGFSNPLVDISKVFGKIIVAILSEHLATKQMRVKGQVADQHACSECGLTWADFEKTGRLGCPQCYDEHMDNLKTLLRRLHGNNRHIGRSSKKDVKDKKESIDSLEKRLQHAITKEEYEMAAELRDRIRELRRMDGT